MRRPKKRTALVCVAVLAVLGMVTFLVIWWYPFGRMEKLEWSLDYFQKVVDKYSRLQKEGSLGSNLISDRGGLTLVEPGPPMRIAFRAGKWGDNWGGYVYDPTGEVLKVGELRKAANANGVPFDTWGAVQADPNGIGSIIMLFGGNMCNCEHLQGDWYWCAFN